MPQPDRSDPGLNDGGTEAGALAKPSRSLTSLTGWLLIGKILSFMMAVALPLLLVRRVSKDEFGLYKQAFLAVGTAIATIPVSFQMSMYYFLPREPKHRGQVVLNVLLWYTLATSLALIALSLFPALLRVIFNSSELMPYARLIGVVIVLWGVASVLESVVVANQESRVAASMIIAAQFSKTVFMLAAVLYLPTVGSLLYAAVAQGIAQTALLLFYVNWRFPGFWRGFNWGLLRRQLSYALPLGLAGVLWTLENDYHNYFVSNRFGAADFAVYSIGCLDIPLVTLLGEAVGSVLIPRAAALQQQGNPRELVELTARAMRKLALVYFPVAAFLWVGGRDFIVALFTNRYLDSWPLFAVNLIMLPFAVLLSDHIVRAYAEYRYMVLRLHAVLLALIVVLLWPATRYFGLLGAVMVVVAAGVAGRVYLAFKMGAVIGVRRSDWRLLGGVALAALAAAAAALLTAAVRPLFLSLKPLFTLIACGACFSASYLAAVLLLKIPEPEERAMVRAAIRRFVPIFRVGESQ